MMSEKTGKKFRYGLTPLTIGVFGIITGLVIIFCTGVLIPKYRFIQELDAETIHYTSLLKRQKSLLPVFTAADRLSQLSFETQLPHPERRAFNRDKIYSLSNIFKQLAIRNAMTLTESKMDLKKGDGNVDYLIITLSLTGELAGFRTWLIDLIGLEYFNRIEEVNISSAPHGNGKFSTTIHLDISRG